MDKDDSNPVVSDHKGTLDGNPDTVDNSKGNVDGNLGRGTLDDNKGTLDDYKGTVDDNGGALDEHLPICSRDVSEARTMSAENITEKNVSLMETDLYDEETDSETSVLDLPVTVRTMGAGSVDPSAVLNAAGTVGQAENPAFGSQPESSVLRQREKSLDHRASTGQSQDSGASREQPYSQTQSQCASHTRTRKSTSEKVQSPLDLSSGVSASQEDQVLQDNDQQKGGQRRERRQKGRQRKEGQRLQKEAVQTSADRPFQELSTVSVSVVWIHTFIPQCRFCENVLDRNQSVAWLAVIVMLYNIYIYIIKLSIIPYNSLV